MACRSTSKARQRQCTFHAGSGITTSQTPLVSQLQLASSHLLQFSGILGHICITPYQTCMTCKKGSHQLVQCLVLSRAHSAHAESILLLKARYHRILVVSFLLYGCEAWTLTAETRQMLASFYGRCVRQIHRITLEHTQKHRISPASLEGKLGISGIAGIIDDLCLRWAGHVAQMDDARLPWLFLTSWVHAKCRCGRPYKSTIHRIQDTIRLTGAHLNNWVELAQDLGS